MSDLRDLIARALYEHHWAGFRGGNFHSWNEIVEGGENRPYPEYPHLVDEFRARADAVIAVLADLPDYVIEQAARGAYDGAFSKHAPEDVDRWDDLVSDFHPAAESWREVARKALAAVFGGEQS